MGLVVPAGRYQIYRLRNENLHNSFYSKRQLVKDIGEVRERLSESVIFGFWFLVQGEMKSWGINDNGMPWGNKTRIFIPNQFCGSYSSFSREEGVRERETLTQIAIFNCQILPHLIQAQWAPTTYMRRKPNSHNARITAHALKRARLRRRALLPTRGVINDIWKL